MCPDYFCSNISTLNRNKNRECIRTYGSMLFQLEAKLFIYPTYIGVYGVSTIMTSSRNKEMA